MTAAPHSTLILACGALAKDIVFLKDRLGAAGAQIDLQCLPAEYHNAPQKIVPGLKAVLDERAADYDRILIGYGDCGTGGGLDRLLEDYPQAERMPGAHCYATFAGLERFDAFMEVELGTFFLTDYLVRFFDRLIIQGLGLDRFPHLKETYFKHYKKLVYLAQTDDPELIAKATKAAETLGLAFEYHSVGFGHLETAIVSVAQTQKQIGQTRIGEANHA